MGYNEWVNNIVSQATHLNRSKRSLTAAREDLTLPVLEQLVQQGYDSVTWDASGSSHSKCLDLHDQKWLLDDFLVGLEHSAPMAERSHPNDSNCKLIVSGPDLPTVTVDYSGNTFSENI